MEDVFERGLTESLSLTGESVILEPLQVEHCADLVEAAADGELWNLNFTVIPNPEEMAAYVAEAINNRSAGSQFPFIVRRTRDGKVVGCTRYYDIQASHRNLAIGYTWYSKSVQRTAVNTETKLLLLDHAFEKLSCISVAFHTDDQNHVSQAAIARLGAKKEGVLRNHRVMPDGRVRHTHCFSICESEWQGVKTRLVNRLLLT